MQIDINQEFKKYKDSADHVAFKTVTEITRDLSVRNGQPDGIQLFNDSGLTIEIMKDGHIGYGATSEMTSEGIKAAFEQARIMTEAVSKNPTVKFNQSVRPKAQGQYISPRKTGLDQMSLAAIYDFLRATSLELKKHPKIVTAQSDCMVIECDQRYISSSGSDIHQNFNIVASSFMSVAQDGTENQTRTYHGGRGKCLQVGAEFFDLDFYLKECDQITREAVELLYAENCPTTTCDLILAPDQMLIQIHESIGHPLELDRILGDERNFAGWSFVEPKDFGTLKYGSPLMNVSFDPHLKHELASYNFDEVGNKAEKKHLIKDGVLVAGLGSLESQFRSGLAGVANARSSSWNRAPIDRMANINLEPGTSSVDDLISQVDNGVIMYATRSWSIDDYRRKFQFGCEYAKKVENGKVTKTLKNPNYRGITVPFWNNLKAVSNASTVEVYGSPYCGKGEPSQVIRVGHSSPYALFSNIEIFGAQHD